MNQQELAKRGVFIDMPGQSFRGSLPELTAEQLQVRDRLRGDLHHLAGEIGERNLAHSEAYARATQFLEDRMSAAGHKVRRQVIQVKGRPCVNLEVEIPGGARAEEIVVIGAHYDSAQGTAGANDNGTGVVAVLALADLLATHKPERTLRLVLLANEESPYFGTDAMGALVYARACKERGDKIVAMMSLETIGYYDDTPGSQKYPPPFNQFYPTTGNFLAFVGNTESAELVRQMVGSFRQHAKFPCEGGAAPAQFEGISRSDQVAFWQCGYPGVMVTDTAPFRYPHYHQASDTPDKVHYDRLARVVVGIRDVVVNLATAEETAR
ncbi:MAG: M28 family peptidase [Planctomycetes bacterium]|nr:M28 family peptidase [Planctomycetota bacterium]